VFEIHVFSFVKKIIAFILKIYILHVATHIDSKHALCAKTADVPLSHHTDGVKANVLHFTHSSEPFAKENQIKIAI
jgi:hypothetical protein